MKGGGAYSLLAFFGKKRHIIVMSEDNKKPDDKSEAEKEHEVLRTFDMYHFFSRKDVLLAIAFIVIMLIVILFKTLFTPEAV